MGSKDFSIEMKTIFEKLTPAAILAGLVLAGCGSSSIPPASVTATGSDRGPVFKGPPSNAGLGIKPDPDPKAFTKLVASNAGRFQTRQDAFALNAVEKAYDSSQASEKVFSDGGFHTLVEAKEEVIPAVYVEPQPYRRLSGVVVGDSILAILEMGQGEEPVIVRPGMQVPNTPWTVVSIDQDKAILRRGGAVLPHEVEVRLETPPPGFGPPAGTLGTGGGQGNFPRGGANGGFPGGPGNFPGGRGGNGRPGGRGFGK